MKNWALTRIQNFPLKWRRSSASTHLRQDPRKIVEIFNVKDAHGIEIPSDSGMHKEPAETALLYTSLAINNFKHDEPWGEINHTSWVWKDPKAKPLLALDRDEWADGTEQANTLRTFHAPWYQDGQDRWIDLVVNNVDDKGHPFHLVWNQQQSLDERFAKANICVARICVSCHRCPSTSAGSFLQPL